MQLLEVALPLLVLLLQLQMLEPETPGSLVGFLEGRP